MPLKMWGVFSVGCSDLSFCSDGSMLPANRHIQLLVFLEVLWPSAVVAGCLPGSCSLGNRSLYIQNWASLF